MSLAEERVVVVDLDPDYEPHQELLRSLVHLNDYKENCRNDLNGFSEHVLVDGLLNVWVYNKKITS